MSTSNDLNIQIKSRNRKIVKQATFFDNSKNNDKNETKQENKTFIQNSLTKYSRQEKKSPLLIKSRNDNNKIVNYTTQKSTMNNEKRISSQIDHHCINTIKKTLKIISTPIKSKLDFRSTHPKTKDSSFLMIEKHKLPNDFQDEICQVIIKKRNRFNSKDSHERNSLSFLTEKKQCDMSYISRKESVDKRIPISKKRKCVSSLSIDNISLQDRLNISLNSYNNNDSISINNIQVNKHIPLRPIGSIIKEYSHHRISDEYLRPLSRTMHIKSNKGNSHLKAQLNKKSKNHPFSMFLSPNHVSNNRHDSTNTTHLTPFNVNRNHIGKSKPKSNKIMIAVCKKNNRKSNSIGQNIGKKKLLSFKSDSLHINDKFLINNFNSNNPTSNSSHSKTASSYKYSNRPSVDEMIKVQPQFNHKKIAFVGSISKIGSLENGIIKNDNQDRLFIHHKNQENDCDFFIICDGHGINGHLVSQFIIENLPALLIKDFNNKGFNKTNSSAIYKLLENNVILTNSKLSNSSEIDTNFSGSTCNVILLNKDIVYCANVGDSRAIIGKMLSKESSYTFETLSRDHKGDEYDESNRINRFGGRVEPFKEKDGRFVGPLRIWLKSKQIPGLAMTRSLGDQIASTVGVICDPEIKHMFIKEEDRFIVLGSDGLWEYITNKDCVNIVSQFYEKRDVNGATSALYNEAKIKWGENDIYIDDITIIVIFFE